MMLSGHGNGELKLVLFFNLLSLSAIAVFSCALLTNFIPFMEMGWLPFLSSKTRYANVVRITFLVGFLIFLGIRYFAPMTWQSLWIVKYCKKLKVETYVFLVCLLACCYFFSGAVIGFTRHQAFETRAFDIGIFAQSLWNTVNGDFLYSSIKGGICLLGDHVSPFLLLLAPLYGLWADPQVLLLIQAFAAASNILIIFFFADSVFQDKTKSFFISLFYFLYLPSRALLHEDFHPEVLMEPVMLLCFWCLVRGYIVRFMITLLLILSAKENMAAITFILGFYACFFEKRKWLGLSIMMGSIVYLYAATQWIVPTISGEPYLYRGSYDEIIKQPRVLLAQIFSGESITYVLKAFSPLGFLSLFHPPTLLLTFPVLAQNLISENPATRSFNYHYTVGLTSFVFISAIYGWQHLQSRHAMFRKYSHWVMLGLIVLSVMRSGPSEYYYFHNSRQNLDQHKEMIRSKIKGLESEYSVLTHNNLIPQVVNRKHVYQLNYNPSPTKGEMAADLQVDYVLLDKNFWEPNTASVKSALDELKQVGYFIEYEENGFYMLRLKRS